MFLSTLYLFLAHLLSDFILQPQKLVDWKHRGMTGIIVHTLIHWSVMMIILLPFGLTPLLAWVAFSIAFSHFLIDKAKIILESKTKCYFNLFILDQTAHILLLLLAGFALKDLIVPPLSTSGFLHFYTNGPAVFGLSILIITTYTYEIARFQLQREKKPSLAFKPDYRHMLKRLAIVGFLYAFLLIFGVYRLAAFGG